MICRCVISTLLTIAAVTSYGAVTEQMTARVVIVHTHRLTIYGSLSEMNEGEGQYEMDSQG